MLFVTKFLAFGRKRAKLATLFGVRSCVQRSHRGEIVRLWRLFMTSWYSRCQAKLLTTSGISRDRSSDVSCLFLYVCQQGCSANKKGVGTHPKI